MLIPILRRTLQKYFYTFLLNTNIPCKISGNSREVGIDEFLDDESDLALEDGVEEFHDEDEAHAQNDERDDQDDDSGSCVAQVPLREQRITYKTSFHL